MEIRFYHILLKPVMAGCLSLVFMSISAPGVLADEEAKTKDKLRINSELFDISVMAGVMNIEDFPSEVVVGASLTFRASEDFFLQYNYLQADIGESSIEKNPASPTLDLSSDRSFNHYDLLLGYNIFHGEFFASDGDKARLSTLYTVAGIGNTEFGDESNFSYTLGLGYKIEFARRYSLRFDLRDYIYKTSLVLGGSEDTVHNTQLSIGVGYMF